LEACTAAKRDGVPGVLAIGSGSSPARQSWLWIHHDGTRFVTQMVALPRLYDALRADSTFTTSELNLEGVVWLGDRVRLFQRSNGLALREPKRCATCELSWGTLLSLLDAPETATIPAIEAVTAYDLGAVEGVRLTFTDATALADGRVLFVASAESSPNAIDDGHVVGTALGVIERDGSARMCPLQDEHGRVVTDKAEGVALFRDRDDRVYLVFDPDDHTRPALLTEVELRGF
jgi:hypothetical protein